MLRLRKSRKIIPQKIAVTSVKSFCIIVDIKLGCQYEPVNLDVNKACFAKYLDIPSTHEESRFEVVSYFNLQGMT